MYHDQILETYRSRFHELSPTKRFHFASRLNLASRDAWARIQLDELKSWFLGGHTEAEYIERLVSLGQSKPDRLHLNAAKERLPLLEKSPWLFGYELQLFQLLHARMQYGADLRHLLEAGSTKSSNDISALANDPRALAVLSTYLVDVYYLHYRLLENDENALIPLSVLEAALDIEFDPTQRPRLNVYLLTHCIIGETLFYARHIPAKKHIYYQQLAAKLTEVAETHWNVLTLDNKLEVALCLQLVGIQSDMIERAIGEANAAFDETVGFITDPKMPHKNDLEWAEHRNVLYVMVTTNR